MDGVLYPQGELPPSVYWRRRVIVLAVAILVILVAYYLIRAATHTTSNPAPVPSASPEASPGVSGVAVTGPPCESVDLMVVLAPTPRDFPDPDVPTFDATLTNAGLVACVVDTSPENVDLLVTSGSDRIWSSSDCDDPAAVTTRFAIEPNESRVVTLTWPRHRSTESCATDLPAPRPGTYHAVATIDGKASNDATFTLSD